MIKVGIYTAKEASQIRREYRNKETSLFFYSLRRVLQLIKSRIRWGRENFFSVILWCPHAYFSRYEDIFNEPDVLTKKVRKLKREIKRILKRNVATVWGFGDRSEGELYIRFEDNTLLVLEWKDGFLVESGGFFAIQPPAVVG